VTEVEYLNLEDLLKLFRTLEVGPVRDVSLLDSAAARPRSSAFG
jgi:death-on-curing protein